jgi:hypothetical protein
MTWGWKERGLSQIVEDLYVMLVKALIFNINMIGVAGGFRLISDIIFNLHFCVIILSSFLKG